MACAKRDPGSDMGCPPTRWHYCSLPFSGRHCPLLVVADLSRELTSDTVAIHMAKEWYVVHTYSGYERKAKAALEERIRTLGKKDSFGDVLVPEEQVVELVKGKKRTSARKFFPGYILVQMEMNNETWHVVKSTPKVTDFVGGSSDPQTIPPVSETEVSAIHNQVQEGTLRPKPKVLFEAGEGVKVMDGPFQDFTGVVEEVKPEKGKLRVLISIFGRATPVELDLGQVEKT